MKQSISGAVTPGAEAQGRGARLPLIAPAFGGGHCAPRGDAISTDTLNMSGALE